MGRSKEYTLDAVVPVRLTCYFGAARETHHHLGQDGATLKIRYRVRGSIDLIPWRPPAKFLASPSRFALLCLAHKTGV